MNKVYRVLIVTGGYLNCDWAAQWLKGRDISYCIAADRGLLYINKLGINVDCILGDYDSVDTKELDKYRNDNNANIVTFPTEKDYTDTHLAMKKALHVIKEKKTQALEETLQKKKLSTDKTALYQDKTGESFEIIILGAIGTRLDHTMTNIFCMNEVYEAGIDCYMIDKYNKIYICDNECSILKKEQYGSYVSILPMTTEVFLTLRGMKYNLNHYCLRQGVSICQSNEIEEESAQILIEKGKVIIYETRDSCEK